MMTRSEHLEWAKQRAREYLDAGDTVNAVASILSDLPKHEAFRQPGYAATFSTMTALLMIDQSVENARRIIEGFN